MFAEEAGLERFVEDIRVEVGFELSRDTSLKDFGQKEFGDGPVVLGVSRKEEIGSRAQIEDFMLVTMEDWSVSVISLKDVL